MSAVIGPESAGEQRQLRDALKSLKDLLRPNPAIYWADLLITAAVGWGSFAACVAPPWSWWTPIFAAFAALALYRALLFMHELTHLRRGQAPGFHAAWNLLFGYPMMLPSVFYEGVHGDHHRPNTFGTDGDPEYLPLRGRRWAIVASCLSSLTPPLLLPLRFLVAGPLGLVCPPLQRLLEERYSSISVNPRYRRSVSTADHRRIVRAQIAVLLFWVLLVGLAWLQILPWRTFAVWYGVCTCVYILNEVRGLGVHRYQSEGKPVDRIGQLRDSIDTPGGVWMELWMPIGMRYHALHHLVPGLPYHNLGAAYRRLLAALPADSVYRASTSPRLTSSIQGLWRGAASEKSATGVRKEELGDFGT